jgi:hypothetical protein
MVIAAKANRRQVRNEQFCRLGQYRASRRKPSNALGFKNRGKGTIKKRNMQENVRYFDVKLHKNAYFSVCKVHKIAKSVISIGQKD